MDAEDRRLLSETHAQAATTAEVVKQFIEWSKEVHSRRDAEIASMHETMDEHTFYIRVLKWIIAPLTPVGIFGVAVALIQWFRAHVTP